MSKGCGIPCMQLRRGVLSGCTRDLTPEATSGPQQHQPPNHQQHQLHNHNSDWATVASARTTSRTTSTTANNNQHPPPGAWRPQSCARAGQLAVCPTPVGAKRPRGRVTGRCACMVGCGVACMRRRDLGCGMQASWESSHQRFLSAWLCRLLAHKQGQPKCAGSSPRFRSKHQRAPQ